MQRNLTPINGLVVIDTVQNTDKRGCFSRLFCQLTLSDLLMDKNIVQINHSITNQKGALRGLHYQKSPAIETKLVRCLRGEVFDVAVDLRPESTTFLHWYGQILSAQNAKMMLIPDGFAHGFQALQDDVELLYLHTEFYQPSFEGGIHYQDPKLNIQWPLAITDISEKDAHLPYINDKYEGLL
tara:strand:+ start:9030 stop:9578 length:549 start_codon:yes stop_codon:yes gene_type:complete